MCASCSSQWGSCDSQLSGIRLGSDDGANVIAVTRHANRLTIATRLFSGKGRVYPVRWQLTAIWTAGLASGSDASDKAKSMLERTILNC